MTLHTILRDTLDYSGRRVLPDLTDDTLLDSWFGPIDRVCVAVAIEEVTHAELSDDEIEAWQSVGDIRRSFEGRKLVDSMGENA